MKTINLTQVMNILNGNGILLITSPNCNICKTVKALLKEQDKIATYQVEPDQYLVKRLKLKSATTCIKFVGGKEVKRLTGLNTKQAYLNLLK